MAEHPQTIVIFGASGDLTSRKLIPSLYRLEQDGKLKAEWRPSENNRNAKYYALTASGRRQLEQHKRRWERVSFAISSVLEGA